MRITTVLFDLDGVLVDACQWHFEAFNAALKEVANYEISPEDHLKTYNGLPTKAKLDIMITRRLIREEMLAEIWRIKQEKTTNLIEKLAFPNESVLAVHYLLRGKGIASACVTNAIRNTAELMLTKTHQKEFLKFIISNEDVKNPKPCSEGYVTAMVRLGVYPKETLIVEDSDKGWQAAIATGAHVMRVKDPSEVTVERISQYLGGA